MSRLVERHQSGEYLDVHVWIFTPSSFLGLTKRVCEQYELPMGLRRFMPTRPMSNEFLVQLEKLPDFQEWDALWPKGAHQDDELKHEQDHDSRFQKKRTINLSAYDFVDFGCSAGGSIAFARDHLGGRRGLGLDISPKKVEAAKAAGFDAEVADVTKLDPQETGTVRFAIMSHFLEHLPGRDTAQACIKSACDIAEDFVLIRQPYFDANGYLFSLGMKLYWSDWTGHSYHMQSIELHNVLSRLNDQHKILRFLIFFRSEIKDSSHAAVHPLSSPVDQHQWNPQLHNPKPDYKFTFPVYGETGAIILPKRDILDDHVDAFLRSCMIAFDSAVKTPSGRLIEV
jgi:hypothetical protein